MKELIPIFICAIMPIAIVLIVYLASMNSENKRAKVLIKAIESNNTIDADKLAEALQKPKKTPLEILNGRLLRGCIFFFIGIVLIIIGGMNYSADFIRDDATMPLIFGGCSLAIGISYLIVFLVTRKQIGDNCDKNHK